MDNDKIPFGMTWNGKPTNRKDLTDEMKAKLQNHTEGWNPPNTCYDGFSLIDSWKMMDKATSL